MASKEEFMVHAMSDLSQIEDAKESEHVETLVISNEDIKKIKTIRRRLDMRLVLMLAVLYLFAFLDRANLGSAYIAGMNKDLRLTVGSRYSIVAMIFFVGYAMVDIPSTMILRYVPFPVAVPLICFGFGILTLGQGFVHYWGGLLVCRLLLGVIEGVMLPISVFSMQLWYTRYEFQKRIGAYYLMTIAGSGLAGLLAFGIQKMGGTAGKAGWQWIFILEGLASCTVALVAFGILVDLPHRATRRSFFGTRPFLTSEESAVHKAHIQRDRGDAETDKYGFRDLLVHVKEIHCWEFAILLTLNNTALYAFNFFLPMILRQRFGYSPEKANLLVFPPFAAALPWMFGVSWVNDKYKTRGPSMAANSVLYITGVSIVAWHKNNTVRYGGVFLGVLGVAANIPTMTAYQASNTTGHSRRAFCVGLMTMGGALGGTIAGNIFRAKDAPNYTPAVIVCIVLQCLQIAITMKNVLLWRRVNQKADRGEIAIMGNPQFRYTP